MNPSLNSPSHVSSDVSLKQSNCLKLPFPSFPWDKDCVSVFAPVLLNEPCCFFSSLFLFDKQLVSPVALPLSLDENGRLLICLPNVAALKKL